MAEQEIFRCNVLITKEEHTAFYLQQQQLLTKVTDRVLIGVGLLWLFLGLSGLFFGSRMDLPPSLSGGALAIGVLCLLFCTVIRPMMLRAKAARIYENEAEIRQTAEYRFTRDTVSIHTSRQVGVIPLREMTAWMQGEQFLVLYFGREVTVVLPMRVMTAQQTKQLIEILQAL